MGYYRLGDRDRERFGCEEWLEFALLDASIDVVTELADRFNFDLSDWPEPFFGSIPFEAAAAAAEGQDVDSLRKAPRWQFQAAMFVALRLADLDVDWDDVGKIAFARVRYVDELPGKGPAGEGEEQEAPSEPSTTQPLLTSSPA